MVLSPNIIPVEHVSGLKILVVPVVTKEIPLLLTLTAMYMYQDISQVLLLILIMEKHLLIVPVAGIFLYQNIIRMVHVNGLKKCPVRVQILPKERWWMAPVLYM